MFNKFLSSPLVKVAARYGAISGVLCLILIVTLFKMGRNPFLVNPYTDFRVLLFAVLLFFAVKEFRDFFNGRLLKMWEGMALGMLFLLVSSVISFIGILIFGAIDSSFLADYISQFSEQIKNLDPEMVKQIGQETIDNNLKALPGTTIVDLASLYVWQTYFTGFFITVIISVILRRQPKPQ